MRKILSPYFARILLITFLACFSHFSTAQVTPKIIGGRASVSTQWPWMAGLVKKNHSSFDGIFCGASLIAKHWILTAAHCVVDESRFTIDIIINQSDLKKNTGERLSVERILIHPLFENESLVNDLALIKLSTPSIHTPITVLSPYSTQDRADKPAIALGWGTTSATEPKYPVQLQEAELSIIDNPTCSATLNRITNDMLCAGIPSAKKDTCQGDSGGPLIVFDTESQSWRQAGITSWGDRCAKPGSYGVYTRIKNYASFISDNICSANKKITPTSLSLSITDLVATARWGTSKTASGYRLHYAPFPQAWPIYSIDLNQLTQFSAGLNTGDAFYVAIKSYKDNCISEFSNIEHFAL